MTGIIFLLALILILIFSVVIHEVAHGSVANYLGDPTAKYAGRLTLNPLKHLDLFGSFLLPIATYVISGGTMVFGAAKPVPINPNNFRDQKYGSAKVAIAGVATNFLIAAVFGLILRFLLGLNIVSGVTSSVYDLLTYVVFINLILGIFNLVPIPPLDGSHVLFTFLPPSQEDFKNFLMRYGWVILIFLFIFPIGSFSLLNSIFNMAAFFYKLLVGAPLIL